MRQTKCVHCNSAFFLKSASCDALGWHTTCPVCDCSFDVDIELYKGSGHFTEFTTDPIGLQDIENALINFVEDLFIQYSEFHGIESGDITPLQALRLERLENNLANLIVEICEQNR